MLQTTFSCRRVTSGSEHSNQPALAGDLYPEPTDEVLAEVDDRGPRGRARDRGRFDAFDAPDRRSGRRNERLQVTLYRRDPLPVGVVEPGLVPAVVLESASYVSPS
jgi:hypothetical protein